MLSTVLAAAILSRAEVDVLDYFPLNEGMVRFYEEDMEARGKKYKLTIIETIGKEVTIKRNEAYTDPDDAENPQKTRVIEEKAFEVLISVEGDKAVPTYYQVVGSKVFIAGIQRGALLERVFPIFAVGDEQVDWTYAGPIPVMGAPANSIIEGTTKPRKAYKFQNKEYPAVETSLQFRINLGGGIEAISEQKAVYAKGLGLVEYEEVGKDGKNTTKRKRKLVKVSNNSNP